MRLYSVREYTQEEKQWSQLEKQGIGSPGKSQSDMNTNEL